MALSRVVSEMFQCRTISRPWNPDQGHWKWYHSTDWVWFPISVL